jgi:hypothetical protein
MKTLMIIFAAACAAVAYYFGLRYFTGLDLGFSPARKYVRNLGNKLLHTEVTAAQEAGAIPQATSQLVV